MTADREAASASSAASGPVERIATVADAVGVHLRIAARIVEIVGGFDAEVRVDGADARSAVALLRLGAVTGTRLRVTATGPDADAAVEAVADALEA